MRKLLEFKRLSLKGQGGDLWMVVWHDIEMRILSYPFGRDALEMVINEVSEFKFADEDTG